MPLGIAAVCVALGVFLALTALGVGGHTRTAARAPYTLTPLATYSARAPHVLSAIVVESEQGAVRGASATPPSELPALPASVLDGPIARYRAYAVAQLDLMEAQIARLEGALAANDRAAAQAAWRAAYVRYLRLGAVYLVGPLATLDQAIDGTAGRPGRGHRESPVHGPAPHRIRAVDRDGATRAARPGRVGSPPTCAGCGARSRTSRSPRSNTRPARTRSSRTRRATC